MVYDLFTRADFCYSKFSFLNLIVWFLGVVWIFWKINLYFFSSNRLKSLLSSLLNWHYDNVKTYFLDKVKGSYVVISGAFLIILGRNVWGLFPYIFGITTQMVLTFSISLVIWLCIVISRMEFSFLGFLSHMTPQGSPGYLAPVLNLIEFVRKLIRPLTLALRLSINITTGHVFVSLMGTRGGICLFSFKLFWLFFVFLMAGYLLFEVGICFIQGFVFRLLRVQYLGEHT